ncbi:MULTISPECIES: YxeA family protein [Bacillus subtilis group]|uniref:YxeA family protein n=1 Tax=Bacillus subtilis group TaxID=653685 RepID=UPI0011EFA7F7|nr:MULTISPECIES: YxeA family protein [Bacillus subtilis group]KAA0835428.1 YxeA family protein [Bacillus paralicheniformis]KAA0842599.1 YxeA family protein [Bacillus paralicheniformis]MBG9914769.1 hypothetical protein [Bacillus sonorensis]MCY1632161.1 YxeA family protein [Bacillus paralicheniformis]MED1127860.1 YxeA family protein [Bacillus paralicheniformis]
MKTRAGGLIAAVLIAVAGVFIAGVFILQKATGGLVPLADHFIQGQGKPEAYYLKAEDHTEKLNNGKYNYTLTGYDASGHKQQIEAEADEKLRPGAFIKVWAYGTKAGSLTEVHEEEIPEGAIAAMKTN